MKPSSPISLLLFLHLAASAPLPPQCLPFSSCPPWMRDILSASNSRNPGPVTPPSKLADPHFPVHQALPQSSSPESHREIEEAFNNSPITPPANIIPAAALSSDKPLESSYLLSLANSDKPRESSYLLSLASSALQNPPQAEPKGTSVALPAKPTSALPTLRKEDAIRYWATVPTSSGAKGDSAIAGWLGRAGPKCVDYGDLEGGARLKIGHPMIVARQYSDLIVVGIVVLFLAAVVVMEAAEYIVHIRSSIFRNRSGGRQGHGEIFLETDKTGASMVKKQFFSPSTPPPQYNKTVGDVESDGDTKSAHYENYPRQQV